MGGSTWCKTAQNVPGHRPPLLVLFDQVFRVFKSNLRYIVDVNGRRTLLMATEHEDPTALVIFLGIFLGTGRDFR